MDINTIVGLAMKYVAATGGYDLPADAPAPNVVVVEDYALQASYSCTVNVLIVDQETLRASSDFNMQHSMVHEVTHWAQCMSGYAFGKRRCNLEIEAYEAQKAWARRFDVILRLRPVPRSTSCDFNGNVFLQRYAGGQP